MEHSIGYYIKAILDHANPVIAILGAPSLICSAIFNLTYLINTGSRTLFLMTLSDYVSLSIAMIPMVLVGLVAFGLIVFHMSYHTRCLVRLTAKKKVKFAAHTFTYVGCLIVVLTLSASAQCVRRSPCGSSRCT